jgi:hypothetical protein
MPYSSEQKKKKVDYLALNSPFMRIPHMDIRAARLLLDLGFQDIFQLVGRSPEVLMEEYQKKKQVSQPDLLPHLRLAVYFAENDSPDYAKLHPHVWK